MPTSLTELFSPACHLCPRRCGAARDEGAHGVCGANDTLKVARAALHMWEEPPISGEAGSGTIFFSGCSLKCIYCQNHEISTGNFGLEISPERLVEIMLELQDQGANNINLVTATHYAHLLPAAIAAARARGLVIPIVYNTSGYERASAVAALGDLVDVWLTDFKYADAGLAQSLSHIKDYPRVAVSGLAQMAREIERRGGELVDEDGLMKRGMIVRHLVLPGHADDSCRVLDLVWQTVGDVPISVMNQYTPNALMREQGGDLARAVTREEYEQVLDHADDLGFTTMFWQEGGAVDESFTPAFDTTGVLTSAKWDGDKKSSRGSPVRKVAKIAAPQKDWLLGVDSWRAVGKISTCPGDVAQLGERCRRMAEAEGSTPFVSTLGFDKPLTLCRRLFLKERAIPWPSLSPNHCPTRSALSWKSSALRRPAARLGKRPVASVRSWLPCAPSVRRPRRSPRTPHPSASPRPHPSPLLRSLHLPRPNLSLKRPLVPSPSSPSRAVTR